MRGGYDDPARVEKIPLDLPAGVRLENVADGATISGQLASGELDAVIGPRARAPFSAGNPHVGYLFADPQRAAVEWFERTRILPVMHLLGLRRELADAHPWLPAALVKAFEQSKSLALQKLTDSSATKVTLPFVEEQLAAARQLMGEDFWFSSLAPNRHMIEAFLRQHHGEGVSSRLLTPEELFHLASLKTHRI